MNNISGKKEKNYLKITEYFTFSYEFLIKFFRLEKRMILNFVILTIIISLFDVGAVFSLIMGILYVIYSVLIRCRIVEILENQKKLELSEKIQKATKLFFIGSLLCTIIALITTSIGTIIGIDILVIIYVIIFFFVYIMYLQYFFSIYFTTKLGIKESFEYSKKLSKGNKIRMLIPKTIVSIIQFIIVFAILRRIGNSYGEVINNLKINTLVLGISIINMFLSLYNVTLESIIYLDVKNNNK